MLSAFSFTQKALSKYCIVRSAQYRLFCKKTTASADEKFNGKEEIDNEKEAKKPIDPKNHEDEAHNLTNEDVKKIKKLISDQDDEIEKLTKDVEKFKNEYRYQLAENDNTVKRYKQEVEKTKEFAI